MRSTRVARTAKASLIKIPPCQHVRYHRLKLRLGLAPGVFIRRLLDLAEAHEADLLRPDDSIRAAG